jgi:hypothetical protein
MSFDMYATHPDRKYYTPFKYASLSQEKDCGQQELPKHLNVEGKVQNLPDLSHSDGEPRPLARSSVSFKSSTCLAGLDKKVEQLFTATPLVESFCDDHHQEKEYVFDKALSANTARFASIDSEDLSDEHLADMVRAIAREDKREFLLSILQTYTISQLSVNWVYVYTCRNGNLEGLEYLLSKYQAHQAYKDFASTLAIRKRQLEVITYLAENAHLSHSGVLQSIKTVEEESQKDPFYNWDVYLHVLRGLETKINRKENNTIARPSIAPSSHAEPLNDINSQFSSLVRKLAQSNFGNELSINIQIDEILESHQIERDDLGWVYAYAARDGALERVKKIEAKCQIENFFLKTGLYLAVKMKKKDVIKHLLSGPLNGCSLELIINMVKAKKRDSIDSFEKASWCEILDLLSENTSF